MNQQLESIRRRVQEACDVQAQSDLREWVLAHRDSRGGHRDLGLLCEQAGLMGLALGEFQLALRDDPEDLLATYHLAQHYRERGDATRALALLERLLGREPAREPWLRLYCEMLVEEGGVPRAATAVDRAVGAGLGAGEAAALRRLLRVSPEDPRGPPPERGARAAEWLPSDADCVRFHTLFSGREGVYARQWAKRGGEGGYSPVHEPLTPSIIRNHLLGTYTVGVYPVRLDATATFFALDLDINKSALQRASGDHAFAQSLRQILQQEGPRLLHALRDLGLAPVFENSGYKGRHYWVFLEQPETAATLHQLGRLLLRWQAPRLPSQLHLEFFPKQAQLSGKGLGNLIKLPLGIHRRTGHRSTLLDDTGTAVPEPFAVLRAVRPLARPALHAVIDRLKGMAIAPAPAAEPTDAAERTAAATALEEGVAPASPATLPAPLPPWTEADFETDVRVRQVLDACPVLAELKRMVDQYRQLSHDEQVVLIHSLGHVEGGPQCVNYLLAKCVDVGPEKFMKSRLKGNPVSCPSIRKKIPHVTRRVACNCAFEFASPLCSGKASRSCVGNRMRPRRRTGPHPPPCRDRTMHTLAISEQGLAVHAEGDLLALQRGRNVVRRVRVAELEQVLLFGRVEVSSGAIALLLRRGVELVWLTQNGRFRGRLLGRLTKHVTLRLVQYRRATDADFCLRLASRFVSGKIHQQRQILLRAQRRLQDGQVAEALGRLRLLHDRAQACTSLDSLRGLEGAAAAAYFEHFGRLLRNDAFHFQGRTRRPPRDEVNAMLSFGYAVLGSLLETELYRCGLDPLLGFFHQPAFGRASLMLDLLEEYRPVIDALVLRLVNRRQLSPQDFERRTGQLLADLLRGRDGAREPAAASGGETGDDDFLAAWSTHSDDGDAYVQTGAEPVDQGSAADPGETRPGLPVIGVYLGDMGRRVFLNELFRRLRERLHYPPRGASFELRDIMREQIYHLARVLESKDEEYIPFVPQ